MEDGRWGGAGGNWKEQLNSVHCLSVFFFFLDGEPKEGEMGGSGERGGMCTKFWLENLKRNDHLEDQDLDGVTVLM